MSEISKEWPKKKDIPAIYQDMDKVFPDRVEMSRVDFHSHLAEERNSAIDACLQVHQSVLECRPKLTYDKEYKTIIAEFKGTKFYPQSVVAHNEIIAKTAIGGLKATIKELEAKIVALVSNPEVVVGNVMAKIIEEKDKRITELEEEVRKRDKIIDSFPTCSTCADNTDRCKKALEEIEGNHSECDGGEACKAHNIAKSALKEKP